MRMKMRTQTAKKVKRNTIKITKEMMMKDQMTIEMTEEAHLIPAEDEDVGALHPQGAEADEGKPQEAVAVEVEDGHDEGNHQRYPGFKRIDGKRDIGMKMVSW